MPDVGHGTVPRRAAKAEVPAETPQGANAAPDESLIAPLEECSVCLNGFERPTITPCAHWFCRRVLLSGNMPPCCEAFARGVLMGGVLLPSAVCVSLYTLLALQACAATWHTTCIRQDMPYPILDQFGWSWLQGVHSGCGRGEGQLPAVPRGHHN